MFVNFFRLIWHFITAWNKKNYFLIFYLYPLPSSESFKTLCFTIDWDFAMKCSCYWFPDNFFLLLSLIQILSRYVYLVIRYFYSILLYLIHFFMIKNVTCNSKVIYFWFYLPDPCCKCQQKIWILFGWDILFIYGNGNPLQYSCLENPLDGGAW